MIAGATHGPPVGRLALVLALLTACQPAQVPLPSQTRDAGIRSDAYPRPVHDAVPRRDDDIPYEAGCGIERVLGHGYTEAREDGSFVVDLPITITGWAVAPEDAPGIPDAWLRMLPLDPTVAAAQFPLVSHLPRPDVVASTGRADARFSGFTQVSVTGLPPGVYHAQVVFASPAGRWACLNVRQVEIR